MLLSPKKPQCSPKFNSHISAEEDGEKGSKEKYPKNMARMFMTFEAPEGM